MLQDDVFESEAKTLSERIKYNQLILDKKLEQPSSKVELEPISEIVDKLQKLINSANHRSVSHNDTIRNIKYEKAELTSQVWKYVINELSGDISSYEQNRARLASTIKGMQSSLDGKIDSLRDLENQVRELEKKTTSIRPTKDTINGLLKTFGFDSFYIDVEDEKGRYRICRKNGDDASRSLSEGEKTFITFLYFYSLIKGAFEASGTATSRVVVFDDPISSLDSDILYIVSSLMKSIIEGVRKQEGAIKQVFVLTHNVYFHKEVTFNPDRNKNSVLNAESFWMVRKQEQGSVVQRCMTNPIRSAYELLWGDVKSGNLSSVNLQNTLRRIIENYFTMWGGKTKDDICELFDGKDKLICQSLFSWVNDGSHSIHDDLYINHGEATNGAYLRIFKSIFEKSEQVGHYNMMVGYELDQALEEQV